MSQGELVFVLPRNRLLYNMANTRFVRTPRDHVSPRIPDLLTYFCNTISIQPHIFISLYIVSFYSAVYSMQCARE